jgi:hypothetical protein
MTHNKIPIYVSSFRRLTGSLSGLPPGNEKPLLIGGEEAINGA